MRHLAIAVVLWATNAHADDAQKLWTKFETSTPPEKIAQLACALDAKSAVEGRIRPIDIQGDGCTSQKHEDAITAVVKTNDGVVIVEIQPPEGISAAGLDDLRNVLRDIALELRRRAGGAPAVVVDRSAIQGSFAIRNLSKDYVRRDLCALNARALVAGARRPVWIVVDNEPCAARYRDAVHVDVRVAAGQMNVSIDPTDESPEAIASLRRLFPELGSTLQGRVGAQWVTPEAEDALVDLGESRPEPPPPPPPVIDTGPKKTVTETNKDFLYLGLGLALGGYASSAIMGGLVSTSTAQQTSSGNWPYLPLIPFVGAVAFSATYRDASDLSGSAAGFTRFVAVTIGVLIDGAQLAGVGFMIAGVAIPKTRIVSGDTKLRLTGNGVALEGRF